MAKPIEATPTLHGDDARRLILSLVEVAPPEEIARRREVSRRRLSQSHVVDPPSSLTPRNL